MLSQTGSDQWQNGYQMLISLLMILSPGQAYVALEEGELLAYTDQEPRNPYEGYEGELAGENQNIVLTVSFVTADVRQGVTQTFLEGA